MKRLIVLLWIVVDWHLGPERAYQAGRMIGEGIRYVAGGPAHPP